MYIGEKRQETGDRRQKTEVRELMSSIDCPFHEPAARVALTKQAIRRAVGQRHVPFITIPCAGHRGMCGFLPPSPRRSPRAGTDLDATAADFATVRHHPCGLAQLD